MVESPSAAKLATAHSPSDSLSVPPPGTTPAARRVDTSAHAPRPSEVAKRKRKKRLTGRIVARAPRIKRHARNYLLDRPTSTPYYSWPAEGRGDKIVDEAEYKRIVELLLHLDFSTLDKAMGSSQRWISEAGMGEGLEVDVVGKATTADKKPVAGGPAPGMPGKSVTNLTGLVRRKNQPQSSETTANRTAASASAILNSRSPNNGGE